MADQGRTRGNRISTFVSSEFTNSKRIAPVQKQCCNRTFLLNSLPTKTGKFERCVTERILRQQGNSVLAGCWKLARPPLSINYALGLLIASRTSEFLSFVLESIVRGGRAPREKHWFAAARTERLVVHAKASRLPQLVPHKPCPPARFEERPNQTMEMCR